MSQNTQNDSTDHNLQDQLIARMDALLQRKREQAHDQDDINTAFEADESWSGQHERPTARSTKGWDTPDAPK